MGYELPTVSDFKQQFPRDFPWGVPAWGAAGSLVLTAGVLSAVAVTAGGFGYTEAPTVTVKAKDGSGATVTATAAKGKVTELALGAGGSGYSDDATLIFTGGAGSEYDLDKVNDSDIAGAFQDADFNVNPDLFADGAPFRRAFCFLAAHMLVEKLTASGEGLFSQYNWLITGKTAGDVSATYAIPKKIMEDPFLALMTRTRYGAMYLQIIAPLLVGNMQTNFRRTPP